MKKRLVDILYGTTLVIALIMVVMLAFVNTAMAGEIQCFVVTTDEPEITVWVIPGYYEFLVEFDDIKLEESFFELDEVVVTTNEEEIDKTSTDWINPNTGGDAPIIIDEYDEKVLFRMDPPENLPKGNYGYVYRLESDEDVTIRLTVIVE